VGIDWAETEHAVCLMDPAGAVRRRLRVPHSAAELRQVQAAVAALRAVARDDERAARDEWRLLNRLRQDLLAVFPEARTAFPRLAGPSRYAFLARWPTAEAARRVGAEELEQFLRAQRHGWPARTAARVLAALAAEALAAPPDVAQPKAGAIRLAAEHLLLLYRQRAAWRKPLAGLLAGAAVQRPAPRSSACRGWTCASRRGCWARSSPPPGGSPHPRPCSATPAPPR
jgi:hypothetical protein